MIAGSSAIECGRNLCNAVRSRVSPLAEEETRPRHLELPDYIRILSKRKWFILVVTAVAALVGGLYAESSEKRYEATALVLVRQRPQGFFWVTGEEASMLPNVAMETYARIVRSSDVAKLAAERLAKLPSDARIIADPSDIQNAISVSVIRPDLLRIDCTSPDARKARYFANYVAYAFVEVNTEDRQSESRVAREFLQEQVAEHETELQAIVNELAAMARESGFVDIEEEVAQAVADLRSYENRRRDTETELRAVEARIRELQDVMEREPEVLVRTVPVPNPQWAAVQEQLTRARLDLKELQAQYTEGHPRVLDAKALVQELEQEIDQIPELIDAETVSANPAVHGIRQELKSAHVEAEAAKARLASTEEALGVLRDQIRDLPEQRERYQALLDRAANVRQAYLALQEDLRQAKLAEAIKQGNARVVDTSERPRKIEASRLRSLAFASALGLFVGLALAILLEALDDTIYSVDDLQRITDEHLLGVIPLRSDEAGPLVTMTAPKSPPAEAYRTLRSNIRFSLFDQTAKSLLITSAGTGEGKSVTAANLAIAYAQSGDSVILVDTDLRRPVLHRLFEVDGGQGVTNILVGDVEVEDVLCETQLPGLRLLPSGPLPPNPAELLESDRMTALIDELADIADIVIFDSPPAVMLSDAGILASKTDRTIVVAESGQVTERAIHDTERLFSHARATVLGVVLNKLRVTGGDYYYYYYYYYYYDYNSRPEHENGELAGVPAAGDQQAAPETVDLNVPPATDQSPDEPDAG